MHDWRADIRARVAAARLHPQDEAELIEEVAQHLEAQFDDLAGKIGNSAARAKLLAQLNNQEFDDALARRRRLAKPTQSRTWTPTSWLRDVRYGVRSLRRSPGTVAAAVVALALGIGLTTVMYSVIYGMVIKGLPFEQAERIAMVYYADPRREDDLIPLGDFVYFRKQQTTFESVGGYALGSANISGGILPDRVQTARITAGLLDVMRVPAMLGRLFIAADNDPASPPTVVLSYALWRDRFSGDSAAVGQTLRVNGRPYTIIGVMPEGFQFPQRTTMAWVALQSNVATLRAGEGVGLTVAARLRPDATYERANAELTSLSRQLAAERPPRSAERRPVVMPFVRGWVPARVYTVLYAMLAAVLMVLVVACANVANLLLDRAVSRTREIGIRTALGASRLAVIRQSLVESTILAGVAALLGALLAKAGIIAFNRAFADSEQYFWTDIELHPAVLVFALAMGVVASLVSGILPAVQSAKLDISSILKDESHAASSLRIGRLSRTIVAVELALSSMLILASAFITKSITNLRTLEPGFAVNGIFTARVTLPARDTVRQFVFFESLEQALNKQSGLTSVYLGSGLPGAGWGGSRFAIEGRAYERPEQHPMARSLAVTPGFFETFGVRVVRGRAIAAGDRRGALPVAVVSESLARRLFPGVDPIGSRIKLDDAGAQDWVTIVGVMPTLYAASFNLQDPWPPELLTSFWQARNILSTSIAVRGSSDAAAAAPIRKVVTGLDPEIPLYDPASMQAVIERPVGALRLLGSMFVIFGIVALVLSAIGLYAVMSFSVSRRVRELGIRMALGASASNIVGLVCRQGSRQILIGMSVGMLAGAAIVRAARGVLFEVNPTDPTIFAIVGAVLGAAAFIACLVPAVGATRVDPLVALRTD
jgi:putative ABC transport system permease protein